MVLNRISSGAILTNICDKCSLDILFETTPKFRGNTPSDPSTGTDKV